ncbi:MAG: hypothetical protein ACE37F_03400 [Nannocystaceae bacterium]|nr:hypothetical protein [bacterium]
MRGSCLSILLLTACPLLGGQSGGDPCIDDANACGNGGVLEVDPTCERDDALHLELGEGDGDFSMLVPGAEPELVSGPQGGEHMVLGIGIDNPSPEHLSFEVAVTLSVDDEGESEPLAERTVVYDGDLVQFDAGRAELLNLVIVPDHWPSDGRRWISVEVTDGCGRTGTVDHAVDAPASDTDGATD